MIPEKLRENPKVLIIKPSSFGDVIHSLPVASAIKKASRDIEVDWVVADNLSGLIDMCGNVNGVIPFRRARWTKWWRPSIMLDILGRAMEIRGKRYQLALDLQGLLRSGIVAQLSNATHKLGFASAREGAWMFYTDRLPTPPEAVHAVDRYMSTLGGLGISHDGTIDYGLVEKPEDAKWAGEALPDGPFAVLNPNSRWKTKRWPIEQFAKLGKALESQFGYTVVIIGGPGEERYGEELRSQTHGRTLDLTGKTTPAKLAALFKRAEVVFTNDSGPLHLAVAAGARTVSFFGPTDPAKTGPYGPGHVVLRTDLFCSPCFNRSCPYNHECMTEISEEIALEAMVKLTGDGKNADG